MYIALLAVCIVIKTDFDMPCSCGRLQAWESGQLKGGSCSGKIKNTYCK